MTEQDKNPRRRRRLSQRQEISYLGREGYNINQGFTKPEKKSKNDETTLRFPLMTAEELNSFGGDNTNVKGYDYANRPIYADEVANHPERKKVFRDIVDKRVVADASEPFAQLDKDGNIVGIPNDNSANKDVGKVFNHSFIYYVSKNLF